MKIIVLVFILLTNLVFAQDLEIKIPDERIELTSENSSNLCYSIKNNSTRYYKVLADSTGFSTGQNEAIDEPNLGLLNLRIIDGDKLLVPISGSYGYQKEPRIITPSDQELVRFKKRYQLNLKHDYEWRTFYDINKRIINIPPKESIALCTKISLPIYRSVADDGSLYYDVKNQKEYSLQLFLNIPAKMLRKYSKVLNEEPKKYRIFSGNIVSNKIDVIIKD
ncbi:hypothetical protein [Chryseobacterium sp. 22458]|uniref:hypothetical protein n=1 Tax=Chryseobacterium sp. 22458 TaxID=3453921 RepID=UPI003F85364A